MPEQEAGQVQVQTSGVILEGNLLMPDDAQGVILFAHGSGSSRHSSRNQYVAKMLRSARLGTLLIDLLTSEEERVDQQTRQLRFDIEMLATRLVGATDWLAQQPQTQGLSVGLFGASTGGGAALIAATKRQDRIGAVVSRGGRPDLAKEYLPLVQCPTLLIVGANDAPVIVMNREAFDRLTVTKELTLVAGATHLFEEPGALEEVARLATDWFVRVLSPGSELM